MSEQVSADQCCTWEGCAEAATKPQIAQDGKQWAALCDAHAAELDEAIKGSIPKMMSAWIKAQGGARAAARRM